MSTKINSRSPFYITATEPTVAEGAFDCTVAGLANFSVEPDGTIINPTLLQGTIIAQDQTSFAAIAFGGSSVARTVNYTIKIPDGFSNTASGTFSCPATFTQTAPSSACNSSSNKLTFSGSISNLTNVSSGTSITLSDRFSVNSAAFLKYELIEVGQSAFSAVFSNINSISSTLTFSTGSVGVESKYYVAGFNAVDNCVVHSNLFTVSSAGASVAADCNDVNLVGGSITSNGIVNIPSYTPSFDLQSVKINTIASTDVDIDISSIVQAGTASSDLNNTTGSTRDIVLTLNFKPPNSFTNSGSTIDCDVTITQDANTTPALSCTSTTIAYNNFLIADTGDIVIGGATVRVDTVSATIVSATTNISDGGSGFLQAFPKVSSVTARTMKITFIVPTQRSGANYSNTGSQLTCDVTGSSQNPDNNPCSASSNTYRLSLESFGDGLTPPDLAATEFCDNQVTHAVTRQVQINSSGVNVSNISVGNIVCQGGTPINGGNRVHAISRFDSVAGDTGSTFQVIQIDQFGMVTAGPFDVNCNTSDFQNDNIM